VIAQEFGKQYPSELAEFVAVLKDTKQAVFDSTQNVLSQVSTIFTALQARVDDLAAVVSGLAAAVTRIDTLVGQQVTGDTGNASTGGAVAVGTGAALYAPVTIAIPAGYSVARVMASSSCAITGGTATYLATRIAGGDGLTMPVLANSSGFGNGAASFARTLTGLNGGTITIASVAYSASGGSSAYISTSAIVTFLR